MSSFQDMQLIIQLPLSTLYDGDITSLIASSSGGSFGLLPNHIDYLSDLVPSVMVVAETTGSERYFGIDEGMLIKRANKINVVTRRGIVSEHLTDLDQQVIQDFMRTTDSDRVARSALSRLEADMVRRFSKLQRKPSW